MLDKLNELERFLNAKADAFIAFTINLLTFGGNSFLNREIKFLSFLDNCQIFTCGDHAPSCSDTYDGTGTFPNFHSEMEPCVNPATGLVMVGSIDTAGNAYGCGSTSDMFGE